MEEEWRDIEGYEGLYQVSNCGRVKSLERLEFNKNGRPLPIKERILSTHSNGFGHLKLCLSKSKTHKKHYVHRLMAVAFLEKPKGNKVINHKDGDPTNNTLQNIEWVSTRENVTHGLKKEGSRKKGSKFLGVHITPYNKYKATIYVDGKHNYLGTFDAEKDAMMAYQKALIDYRITNKYAKSAMACQK